MSDQERADDDRSRAVQRALEAVPVSMAEIAERTGLTRSHVSMLKNGKRGTTERTAKQILGVLYEIATEIGDAHNEIANELGDNTIWISDRL